ncbi:UDPdiphospho-muramoylpentapeptide beta-N-acetylglucosaminyltransferase [Chlamydia trachomatis]|nr:UDPdiphospho-muramoylpentapeptide beta-N-acetylglucosaminyltransferase [Chlamydia trachomatis]
MPTLLFVGGSAGAKVFNDFITENKTALTEKYNVINLTGDPALNELSQNLYRVDYATDLYLPLMEEADLVVTRGGSNTIFELVAMAKLHLIVPLGRQASRGDQLENAQYFEKKGYAEQMDESQLNLDNLIKNVTALLDEKDFYLSNMEKSTEIQSVDSFYELLLTDMERKTDK